MPSNQYSLNFLDVANGILMAILGVIITALYAGLSAAPPHFPASWAEWQTILLSAAGAAVAYLVKKFFQGPAAAK